jgi:hypothetical protein
VHEYQYYPLCQGPHTFTGYEDPKPSLRICKVVPIATPGHFIRSLNNLISEIEYNNTEFETVEPSPYDPLVGTFRDLKDQETYEKELEEMYEKYSDIHTCIMEKFTNDEKDSLQKILTEAMTYQPNDDVWVNPDWRPGWNPITQKPYNPDDSPRYRQWQIRKARRTEAVS